MNAGKWRLAELLHGFCVHQRSPQIVESRANFAPKFMAGGTAVRLLTAEIMPSHARNKLSDRRVQSEKKPGLYGDGGGLYLRIRPSGRSWIFIGTLKPKGEFRIKKTGPGKRIEMGLGSALDVPLAKARQRAAEIREVLLEGIDPRVERLKSKEEAKPADDKPVVTFGAFAMELLDSIEDGFRNPKHRAQWRSTLKTHAEKLLEVPIADVSTEQIVAVLEPIWLSKRETASRLRGRIERVLDAARVKGLREGENPARGRGHLELLLPKSTKTVRHHPALPFKQVAEFITGLRQRSGMAARALEFTILTAARSGETRGMTWAEVNLEERLWTVPASRMKAGATHEVPLSDRAMAILNDLKNDKVQPHHFVFPAQRSGSLSDMTLSAVIKRMQQTGITVHGFRSTFRDWAGEETSFEREVIEMALAHTVASSVERAYRRGRALEKRRDLMTEWAKYCFQEKDTEKG
ncbi:site-specific integrase [uncultured Novosphingobium sp.]|uniref:tyrosine-type recombinase/integrase n=1 Tax=uncultured Novosphingobium sp. TaxID=292277 RepID=UPI0025879DF8|nr:site-specific integrase [uncultured Novosphingobium sp.]